MIDEEEFVSFDECTTVTWTYLHYDSYGPVDVCDVYHNAHMNCLGFDLNTADNTYHLSLNVLLRVRIMRYCAHTSYSYLLIMLNKCLQLLPSGSAYCIPFCKHFKSCFLQPMPAITTNPLLPILSAFGSNVKAGQIIVGCNSNYIEVYGIPTNHDFSCILEENIMN